MKKAGYIIVTPVKNQEASLRKTIRSVISQTVPPLEWVIVNDGSTDGTGEIAAEASLKRPWIKALNLDPSDRAMSGHIVRLFNKGFGEIESRDYGFVAKVDGGVTFEQDYFEKILNHFEENTRLAISGGVTHVSVNGELVEGRSSHGHVTEAARVYRKVCFEAIGGLSESIGWDCIDEIKTRMLGWDAEPVPGLAAILHRDEGKAAGVIRAGIERGRSAYFMGCHPLYLVVSALGRMVTKSPPVADGMGMLIGYLGSMLKGEQRIKDSEFICFLRKNQIRKMLLLKNRI